MPTHNTNELRQLLKEAKVIAVVGHSDQPFRTSYSIGRYLVSAGFKVYPVNPTITEVDGDKAYATLADVPEPVDIVNVFRRAEFLDGVVDQAIAIKAKAVWAQLGVVDRDAARKAEEAGLTMVMDRCIMVDHRALVR
jgi:predicted CoA-binding protein